MKDLREESRPGHALFIIAGARIVAQLGLALLSVTFRVYDASGGDTGEGGDVRRSV